MKKLILFLMAFLLCQSAFAETTILRPNSSSFATPLYWSAVPSGDGNVWWQRVDETPPNDNTDYIRLTGAGSAYTGVSFQDLFDGENPPTNDNITINSVKIYAYVKDHATGFPSSNSSFLLSINGWSTSGIASYISYKYAYKSATFTSVIGAPITIKDVNTARCSLGVSLGLAVEFHCTQMYLEVNWDYNEVPPTVHIKGGHIRGGHIL